MNSPLAMLVAVTGILFLLYLLVYATYLFLSVALGAWRLYHQDKMLAIHNELKHEFYVPVSILVPAHNEEVTNVESVESLLGLDYRLYEVIVLDDGSTDATAARLVERFSMQPVHRPVRLSLPCQPIEEIFEARGTPVPLMLVRKRNGGKGDALNTGINVAQYPYFLCIDADSMLQRDSLEHIVQPVMEDDDVVAVGGQVCVSQGVRLEEGRVVSYHLPRRLLVSMQALEYERSFLASRILLDGFNGNLIVSGAFGLYKKDVVVAAGGYDTDTLGEDMELVMKLHAFCRNNLVRYAIRYEPRAVCWSQAPSTWRDLAKQRRRWHMGLFECMTRYRFMFGTSRYGLSGSLSYLYYLLYELYSPLIELAGVAVTVLAAFLGLLNLRFMVFFFLLYAVYGAVLTLTAFLQRIYMQRLKTSPRDIARACLLCAVEFAFFRLGLDYVRTTALIGYRKNRREWGTIARARHTEGS